MPVQEAGGPEARSCSPTITQGRRADLEIANSKVDKIRKWTVHKSKESPNAAQRAMQDGFRRAKIWTVRYSKDGNIAAQKALSNSIDKARYVGGKVQQTMQDKLEKAKRTSEEMKMEMKKEKER